MLCLIGHALRGNRNGLVVQGDLTRADVFSGLLGDSRREWRDAAGLPGCFAHGLREARARRLGGAGATALEVMGGTGHKTLAEVERHTTAACREALADEAMQKPPSRPNREQARANLSRSLARKLDELMKEKGKS